MQLDPRFVQRINQVHGAAGSAWLAELPRLLAELAARWSLTLEAPVEALSYNFVTHVRLASGAAAILKLGPPEQILRNEIAALRLYGGKGCVQLLAADSERCAVLLERLQPGTMLVTLDDDQQATRIAAQVMRALWRPVPAEHTFPTLQDWFRGFQRLRKQFDGGSGPFPERLLAQAERLYAELLASQAEPVLLHADLHHFNILAAQRAPWLAIDPQGVVGEAAYEVGALMRNPLPELLQQPAAARVLARRLDLLAEELALDRQRLLGWSMAQAVLSAWWSYEDHEYANIAATLRCAELLAEMC